MKKIKALIQLLLRNCLIQRMLSSFNVVNAKIFSSTYLLSVPYHWVAFLSFMREQRAVLYGKKIYYENLNRRRASHVELRRNIHRLEKGLLMQPMRKVFAENYIVETVRFYQIAIDDYKASDDAVDIDELLWSRDVLKKYFSATTYTKVIKKASDRFKQIDDSVLLPQQTNKIPYTRPQECNLPSYESLLSLSLFRRSVRWFQQRPVDRNIIDRALVIARQSPSACNRLPYEFKIFDDPEMVNKVADIPFGTVGYANNIPVIAVLVGKLNSYFSARDRHAIYIDTSLAAMGFCYGLEVQGVSTCIINWPDFEPLERKMQKMLSLTYSDRVIMLIAIGYADPQAKVAFSQKKHLETIREYNIKDSNKI